LIEGGIKGDWRKANELRAMVEGNVSFREQSEKLARQGRKKRGKCPKLEGA